MSESSNPGPKRRGISVEALLGITRQERKVVDGAAKGMTDKEIAKHRGITVSSVRTYWDRLRERLKANSRTHVVAIVSQAKLRETQRALQECEEQLPQGPAERRLA